MNSSLGFGDSYGDTFYSSKLQSIRDKHLKGSTDLSSINNNNTASSKIQIEELLRCIICFGKVKNPQMCPSCSKLCCSPCIKKWLTEQKSQCPHCRCSLRVSQLVNCRFVSEIATAIEQINTKREEDIELCSEHQAKLSYYCKSCEMPICADCAMFGTDHKNHQFEHITKVYEVHVELVKKEAHGLKNRLKELTSNLASVETTIDKVTRAKEEKATELEIVLEQMNQRLESELKSKLLALLAQKGSITDEIEFLESMQSELNRQLMQSPKSVLIMKSIELVKMLREINAKPITKYDKHSITPEFRSELIPTYDSATFFLRPFSILRQNTEVVYSEPLHANGLTWRLKVYPNGNGAAKNEYLSVFLEMMKGLQDLSKYEYKVEMINQRNPDIVTIREFASEFETGECWGYNKFFKIDLLERDGYLVPEEDTVYSKLIVLKYFVRAPSYYQQCQDQKRYIQHLERLKNQSNAMIAELKDKLNHEMEKNRKIAEMNPSLLSTLKNSTSRDRIDERNEEIILAKSLPRSEIQSDHHDQSVEHKAEEVEDDQEEEEEEEKEEDDDDDDQDDDESYEVEKYQDEPNVDVPTTEKAVRSKQVVSNQKTNEKNLKKSLSPSNEEYKYQDLFGSNFEADLDGFLKNHVADLSATDQEGLLKKASSNDEHLQEYNLDDNLQLKSLHQSSNENSESLDELCERVSANIEAADSLKPIALENIFNTKNSAQDNNPKRVIKNLLPSFDAESTAIEHERSEEKKERFDISFLQLSDSLVKKLGNLKSMNGKERISEKSEKFENKKPASALNVGIKTERVNENEKENRF